MQENTLQFNGETDNLILKKRAEEAREENRVNSATSRLGIPTEEFKRRSKFIEERDFFLSHYGDLIPTSGHIYIQAQMFEAHSILDFHESVLFVLKHSYSFFDKKGNLIEDKKYNRILNRIRKYDPAWKNSFELHHQQELERIERVRKGKPFRPSQ